MMQPDVSAGVQEWKVKMKRNLERVAAHRLPPPWRAAAPLAAQQEERPKVPKDSIRSRSPAA